MKTYQYLINQRHQRFNPITVRVKKIAKCLKKINITNSYAIFEHKFTSYSITV